MKKTNIDHINVDNGHYTKDQGGQECWHQGRPRLVHIDNKSFWDSQGYINILKKGTIEEIFGENISPNSMVSLRIVNKEYGINNKESIDKSFGIYYKGEDDKEYFKKSILSSSVLLEDGDIHKIFKGTQTKSLEVGDYLEYKERSLTFLKMEARKSWDIKIMNKPTIQDQIELSKEDLDEGFGR